MITHSSICGIHVKTLSKIFSLIGSLGCLLFFAILKLSSFLSFNIFILLFLNFVAYIYALNGTIRENPFQFTITQILLLPNIGAAIYVLDLAKKAMIFHFMTEWVYVIAALATIFIVYTIFVIFIFHRTKKFLVKELQRRHE